MLLFYYIGKEHFVKPMMDYISELWVLGFGICYEDIDLKSLQYLTIHAKAGKGTSISKVLRVIVRSKASGAVWKKL